MNFNEFYLNSFKDSNDILDGSNVIIKGNVAVNKLNPSQHIDVSGNIKASNKLIANILELSGNNITVDNSNNITFNKAKFSHIFPAIPADISASANNANDGGTDIGDPTNAFRKAYIQELFVSKNSISLGDDVKISATDTGNLNATTSVSGVETTTKIIRADPNGQISPDDMAFTGLRFRNNFKPDNTSNDNNAIELNTLKNSISDLSNGDYLICHSFFKIGQPSSAFTEQIDISGKDISSGDILIWVQNTKWALVNFKVPYFSLEANHIVDGSLPISKTTGLQTALNNKQNTLIAGTGITINGDTISSTSTGGLTDLSQTSINDLSDVSFNVTTTTNGKALIWNSTTKLWEPGQAGNPINETTDVSLNNLKVHGDLSANDASFNNVTLNNITLNNIIGNPTTTTQSTDNSSNRIATTGFVKNNIQSIINNAPAVLDTLSEIANAIDNSANFATNINSNISTMKSDIATKQNSFSAGSHLQLSSNILNVIPSTIKSSDLSDISFNLASIQNNHVLAWDSTNNYFTNSNIIAQQITTLSSEVARDISNIVNGAPAVLDTLKELADAIDGSANFATNVKSRLDSLQSQINTKNSSIDHTTDVEMKDLSANDASFNSVNTDSLTVNGANINVQTRKQQLLEIVSGVCDGRTISGESGNYTLFNVSSVQSLGPSNLPSYNWVESWYNTDSYFFELSGSSIAYTPPSGTRQVIYHFSFNINETSESGSALWFRFFIDDNEVQCLRRNKSNHVWGSNIIDLKYIVDIDANIATDDISNAKLKSWTSSKTMKIDCAVYLNNIKVHCANWNDSAPILAKPTLKIESIGIDENIHTSNNVRIIDLSNNLNAELIGGGTITNTEFSYLDGLTGNIQSQLNLKHSTIDSTTDLNTKDLSANNAKIHDLSVNKIYINSNLQKHIDLSNVTQSIIPSQNNVFTLGDVSNVWKDVYIGPGSLYIDGKKVIESNNDTINITTDENQNLTVKTTGTGILKLESSNGLNLTSSSSSDITINPAGSIKLNSNIQIADGVEIQNPNGNDINFIDNITLSSGKKFIGDTSSNTITCSSLSVNGVSITQNGGGLTNLFQTSINDLSDVSLNGIQTGQYIKWDGEKLVPTSIITPQTQTTSIHGQLLDSLIGSAGQTNISSATGVYDLSDNSLLEFDSITNKYVVPTTYVPYPASYIQYKAPVGTNRILFEVIASDLRSEDTSGYVRVKLYINGIALDDHVNVIRTGSNVWNYSHWFFVITDSMVSDLSGNPSITDTNTYQLYIKSPGQTFEVNIIKPNYDILNETLNGPLIKLRAIGQSQGLDVTLTNSSIGDLSDVSLNGIQIGQYIKWDGEKLVPGTVTSGGTTINENTDISLNNLKVHGSIQTDTINEKTNSSGVTIDGVLLKDSDISLNNLKVHGSIQIDTINEKTNSSGVTIDGVLLKDSDISCSALTVNGVSITQNGGGSGGLTDLSQTSINDLSDVSLNNIAQNQLIKWDGEKLVPTTVAQTIPKQGQVLDVLMGYTGSDVSSATGTYSLPSQTLASSGNYTVPYDSYVADPATLINYTAPAGTKYIQIDYHSNIINNAQYGLLEYRLYVNDTLIEDTSNSRIRTGLWARWSYNLSMIVSAQEVYDTSNVNITGQNKYQIWIKSEQSAHTVRIDQYPKRNSFLKFTAIGESQGVDVTLTNTSIKDISDVSIDNIQKNQLIKWDGEKLVPTSSIIPQTISKQGQVLDVLMGYTGTDVSSATGTYSIPSQTLASSSDYTFPHASYVADPATLINYSAPAGTKYIQIDYHSNIINASQYGALFYKLYVNDTEIEKTDTFARIGLWTYNSYNLSILVSAEDVYDTSNVNITEQNKYQIWIKSEQSAHTVKIKNQPRKDSFIKFTAIGESQGMDVNLGVASINDLSDVSIDNIENGQYIKWNDGKLVPTSIIIPQTQTPTKQGQVLDSIVGYAGQTNISSATGVYDLCDNSLLSYDSNNELIVSHTNFIAYPASYIQYKAPTGTKRLVFEIIANDIRYVDQYGIPQAKMYVNDISINGTMINPRPGLAIWNYSHWYFVVTDTEVSNLSGNPSITDTNTYQVYIKSHASTRRIKIDKINNDEWEAEATPMIKITAIGESSGLDVTLSNSSIGDLSDVSINGIQTGQYVKWDGEKLVPGTAINETADISLNKLQIGSNGSSSVLSVYGSGNQKPLSVFKSNSDCSVRIESQGGESFLEIANIRSTDGNSSQSWGIGLDDGTRSLHFRYKNNETMNINYSDEFEAMTIYNARDGSGTDYNGFVGIGITNPTKKLEVAGDISCSALTVNGVSITQNGGGGGGGGTTINEYTDISLNNLKVHGDLSANDVSFNVMDVDTINSFRMNGHILPTSNAQYDLGSAEYKIRHLFLSDNSLWLGDEHKLDVSGGKMRFRKRKKDSIPSGISSQISGASLADAQTRLGKGGGYGINQFTLHDWVEYSHLKGIPLDVNEIFNEEDIDDDDGIVDSIKNTDMSFNNLQTSTLIVDNSISCGSLTVNGVNITENGGGSGGLTDLSQTSINDLSDVSLNNIAQNQLIKWDGEKLVPTTVAQTIPKHGQLLDSVIGSAGQTDISSATGVYDLSDNSLLAFDATTNKYIVPTTYVAYPASYIQYKAPVGTSRIIFEVIASDVRSLDSTGYVNVKLYINGNALDNQVNVVRTGQYMWNYSHWFFVITDSMVSNLSGNPSITDTNTYQLYIKSYSSSREIYIDKPDHDLDNETQTGPLIKLRAIGESQGVDVTLTNTSIKDISDVSIDNIQTNQYIKWDGEKLVPSSSIIPQTMSKQGQVLDVLMGYTGTDVSSVTGTYSIPSQTLASSSDYTLPTSYVSDPATLINYTAPTGTKFLKIKYYSNITNLDQYGLLQYILYVNDTPISNTETVYRGGLYATNSYNLSILVSAQDVYDTSNVNITGQNKYQIWIRSYSTTQRVRMLQTPTRKSFIKFTVVGESQGMDVNLGVASINDLSDVNIDNIENGQYIKWNDGKLVPTSIIIPQTQTPTKQGQILEKISGICDGRTISGVSGTYTLSNVTSSMSLTTTYTTITGSEISYTPPTGTKQVVYIFKTKYSRDDTQAHSLSHLRLYIDDVEQTGFRRTFSGGYLGGHYATEWTIDIGNVNSVDNVNSRFPNWNSSKTIKIQAREWGSSNEMNLHTTYFWDGGNSAQFSAPHLEIIAIGESSGLDVTLTNSSIGDLSDVSLNGIQTGQYIKWDGEKLVPGTVTSGGTTINETTDVSLNNLKVHGDLSANDASFNVIDVAKINAFRMNGHIIPTSNAQYDLGSAEYKIRHLFLSDNSLWLGDEHKLDISGGKMRFRKRKKDSIPSGISSQISGASLADAQTTLGKGGEYGLNQFTLHDWVKYSHLKGTPLDVNQIFNEQDINDDNGIVDSIKNTDMSFNKLQIGSNGSSSVLSVYGSNSQKPLSVFKSNSDCSIRIESEGGESFLEIANIRSSDGNSSQSWGIGLDDDSRSLHFRYKSNETMNLNSNYNNEFEAITIYNAKSGDSTDYNGFVGIGITNPTKKLEVAGDISCSALTVAGNSITSSQWTTVNTNEIHYSSGNVGIGTNNPTKTLEIKSNDYEDFIVLDRTGHSKVDQKIYLTPSYGDDNNTQFRINIGPYVSSNGHANTIASFQEDGNVGIGITNPTKKLEVAGDISCSALTVAGNSITSSQWTTVNTNEIHYSGGNVGIGTNSPSTLLVVGEDGGGNATNTPGIHMKSTSSKSKCYCVGQSNTKHVFLTWYYNATESNAYAALSTYVANGQANNLVLNHGGGNVGIGSTKAITKLDIRDSGACRMRLEDSTATNFASADASIEFTHRYSTIGYIQQKGENLRIGTTGGNSSIRFYTNNAGSGATGNTGYPNQNGGTIQTQSLFDETYTSSNDIPKMVISKDGNVGIGTTDPSANLHINGTYTNWSQIINTGDNSLIGFINQRHSNTNRPGISFGRNMEDLNNQKNYPNIYSYNYTSDPALVFMHTRFQFATTDSIFNTNSVTSRLLILNNGRVGINDTTPAGYLDVGGTIYSNGSSVSSDRRIKTNIVDVSDNQALNLLRNIPCRYYEYKDKKHMGDGHTIGFIAQEVKEQFPIAVKQATKFIPNIMKNVSDYSWNTILYDKNDNLITERIYDESGNDITVEKYKLTIPDLSDNSGNVKYRFYVSEDSSGNNDHYLDNETLNFYTKSFIFEKKWAYILLYGSQVDDFNYVHKDKLFAVNFSATQELDKLLTIEKQKVATLENKVTSLEDTIQSLISRITALENQ